MSCMTFYHFLYVYMCSQVLHKYIFFAVVGYIQQDTADASFCLADASFCFALKFSSNEVRLG